MPLPPNPEQVVTELLRALTGATAPPPPDATIDITSFTGGTIDPQLRDVLAATRKQMMVCAEMIARQRPKEEDLIAAFSAVADLHNGSERSATVDQALFMVCRATSTKTLAAILVAVYDCAPNLHSISLGASGNYNVIRSMHAQLTEQIMALRNSHE